MEFIEDNSQDTTQDLNNIEVISHDINLRNRGKMKMKTKFSGLTKKHSSPYYSGCYLWCQLPEIIQKA